MKYRIWSKSSECYTHEPEYPGSSLHCASNYYLDPDGNLVDFVTSIGGNQDDATKSPVDQENYIIEEYTGLNDIKGNRIFEGDIVRQKIGRKYEYCNVNWECYGWYLDEFPLAMFEDNLLVVGNIHQPVKKTKK
jgi:hypothetical protein